MARYEVKLQYGEPGKALNNGRTVVVEAESEATAMTLAVNQLRHSNGSTYVNRQIEAVRVKKL